MPIYEYLCDACGHQLEVIQKISEPVLTKCPECAEEKLRKKVSAAGFRLKGGGWYETDFKGSKKKNVSEASNGGGDQAKASGSDTSSASSGKDDAAKPASKPAKKKGDDA